MRLPYCVAQFAPIAVVGPLLVSELEVIQQIFSTLKPIVVAVGGSKKIAQINSY